MHCVEHELCKSLNDENNEWSGIAHMAKVGVKSRVERLYWSWDDDPNAELLVIKNQMA